MSIVIGRPSMPQKCLAHGPGAITTCSPTAIRPLSVSTAVTVSSSPSSKPVTSTYEWIWTFSSRHLSRRPITDSTLKAKPPWCSWRQIVTPFARQSGNSSFMCASTSASPTYRLES